MEDDSSNFDSVLFLIFGNFKGKWKLSRTITSSNPNLPSGTFSGVVSFEDITKSANPNNEYTDLLYDEKGTFTSNSGFQFNGYKQYIYRYNHRSNQMSVWFVKIDSEKEPDYIFHNIVAFQDTDIGGEDHRLQGRSMAPEDNRLKFPGIQAEGEMHLCGNDEYNTHYWFELQKNDNIDVLQKFTISYSVSGPRKDYQTIAVYERI